MEICADVASPNHGLRRDGALPDLVVLHYTAMASWQTARDRLCDPETKVSSHYLLAEDGRIFALVPELARAWHAGAGAWGAVADVNSRSVGIEIANPGDRPFPARQMAALLALLAGIRGRWAIPPERVIAHSDMAPTRKTDPGPRFDWRGLALAGHAVWSDAVAPDPEAPADQAVFLAALARIGYPEAPPDILLSAFRLRFRPWGRGPVSAADMVRAADIAARFPVDAGRGGA
jgi:N-acetylmuramoyl-L-alanine amidase